MTRARSVEERGQLFTHEREEREFLFTVDLMARMDEAGLFGNASPLIELRKGKLIEMAPPGIDHGNADGLLHRELWRLLDRLADKERRVVHATLVLAKDEAPVPDAMVVASRPSGTYYTPAQAELVCEVGLLSLSRDLRVKQAAYAAAGIREYWVLAPLGGVLRVFREPADGAYATEQALRVGDRISPLFAEGRADIAVADLF